MNTIKTYADLGYEELCNEVRSVKCKTKLFSENDCILKQGQTIDNLYWVDCGTFSMDYTAENGKRYSLGNMFVDRFILGELEFLTETSCQFSVIATESIEVKVIPRVFFTNLLSKNANVGIWLSRKLSESYQKGMNSTMNRFLQPIVYSIGWDIYERHMELRPNISFQYIYRESERFGCSERAYRRVISSLVEIGLIDNSENEVIVKDENRLYEFLNSM